MAFLLIHMSGKDFHFSFET